MFDRSAIAREAHRVARIYRGSVHYHQAPSWGLKQAWASAKAARAIISHCAALSPEARARRDEAVAIQCSTDWLTANDYSRLAELSRAA